ncbi:MAG: flagellar biosynthetic protein FliO [Deferribacteraceae bacterium]|jgi:flagellar biogenesis protein FliO|nr:flagellar biosynthetic protein FliO [Deferribacteraceae bacterium]
MKLNAVKLFPLLLLCFIYAADSYAATVSDNESPDAFTFTLTFNKGYSNVDALRNDKEIIISFETTEDVSYIPQEFFNKPVKKAWLTTEGTRNRLSFSFDGEPIEPKVMKEEKKIIIEFPLESQTVQSAPQSPALPGSGAYIRMFFGLAVIIAIILLAYALMKFFFKNNVITDIPGAGRLLGKVDLEFKKSLAFYELGEVIYIIGITDSNINLIDKIADPVDVNFIKSGFSRRKDFSSFMKFFSKKNEIAADMNDSSELIGEKLSSLRKK